MRRDDWAVTSTSVFAALGGEMMHQNDGVLEYEEIVEILNVYEPKKEDNDVVKLSE